MSARRAATAAGIVLATLVIAGGVLLATFNPNAEKPRIVAAIEAATGRKAALDGPIGFSLLPLSVTLHDVSLSNPAGFSRPSMASIRAITLRVAFWPLLGRKIVVRRLVLDEPDITFERNAAGVGNWTLTPTKSPTAGVSPPGVHRPAGQLAILDARIVNGRIAWRDGQRSITVGLPRVGLTEAKPDGPIHAAGDILVGTTKLAITADAGPPAKPFPVRVKAAAGDATLWVAAASAGSAHVTFSSPSIDLSGPATAALTPHPSIHADLSGTRLDLSRSSTKPPAASAPVASPARSPATPQPAAAITDLLPDVELPVQALHAFDADLRLHLAEVVTGQTMIRGVIAHAALTGGVLSVVAHASLDGAPIDLTVALDATKTPPVLGLAVNAPSLPAASLLAAFGEPELASGKLAVAADLRGSGGSAHAIASTLDGFAAASMANGDIRTTALEQALGPVVDRIKFLGAFTGERTPINCLAIRANLAHGKASLAPLLLSSALLTVDGGGSADLMAETLDLHLEPRGRVGGVGFSVPLTLRGGWRDPKADMSDAATAAEGLRAVFALFGGKKARHDVGPPAPSCADALAAARR